MAALSAMSIGGANNLVMTVDANIALPADTLGADPLLAPLADNGGPTRTMGLYSGSPALNAGGNPDGYANDQRGAGFPRVLGAAADIGAFEGALLPAPAPALAAWALSGLSCLLVWLGARRLRRR
jgi:hypothetical protein